MSEQKRKPRMIVYKYPTNGYFAASYGKDTDSYRLMRDANVIENGIFGWTNTTWLWKTPEDLVADICPETSFYRSS